MFPTVPLSLTIPKNFKTDRLMETDLGDQMNKTLPLMNSYCQSANEKTFNKTFKVGVPSSSLTSAVAVCRSSQVGHERMRNGVLRECSTALSAPVSD